MSPAAVNSALQKARETMDRAQLRSDELSSNKTNHRKEDAWDDARRLSF
ncbi:hypothetical protein L0M14_16705 [Paenibacillus hexagrammi]|uniref:Uncharacterized protein n=2 Tax=Paenibacillus hexagrammi TaxID=2908839 RepID=A0ABY3SR23_9BACL|nr:hypothetical protein [Paenibacillus sp. YPD9-1]UJF36386.1 hypothetical protein L0M14_16705 [Paenibacillus sp. YPD9-1]